MKQTKIIATIGPASEDKETLVKLYEAGANVARINCSHFDEAEFIRKVENIQQTNAEGKTQFSILLDTKGPEIRTTMMDNPLEIQAGDTVIVTTPEFADQFEKRLVSDYEHTISDETVGNTIDIDCGLLALTVQEKHSDHLVCYAHHSYTVKNRRHVNLPGVFLKFPGLTEIDKHHIQFGIAHGIDVVAMSFVRNASNIVEYKKYLQEIGAPRIPVYAKIESFDAVENIDEIIEEADGVMVARGDLGAQIPMEQIPSTQEMIIKKCQQAGKMVIVATNMLESMIDNPTPTRAELTDVHNAVMQQADCTMLSGESAIGRFPVETVAMMSKIISHSEKLIPSKHQYFSKHIGIDENKKLVVKNALFLADQVEAQAIIVFTNSGFMGRTCAALRPNQQVFTVTFDEKIARKLVPHYGVYPIVIEKGASNEENLKAACMYLKNNFFLQTGDNVIVLIDGQANQEESVPEMKMMKI